MEPIADTSNSCTSTELQGTHKGWYDAEPGQGRAEKSELRKSKLAELITQPDHARQRKKSLGNSPRD